MNVKAKKMLSLVLVFVMVLGMFPATVFATNEAGCFADVPADAWYADAVQYVADNGLMVGVDDNHFAPGGLTTRGMVVTVLHRMEGEPSAEGTGFTDVEDGVWYTEAILWAQENGIVEGYGDGTFHPHASMTREEMMAVFYRYSQYKGYDVSEAASLTVFTDSVKIQSYAEDAMAWAVSVGLIVGFEDGTIRPQADSTRAQLATVLMRFCTTFAGGPYTVTFVTNGGSSIIAQTVLHGMRAVEPSHPVKDGYSFANWYIDEDLTVVFDFATPITCDITLYARWRNIDNLEDDIIDLGDIENMISEGEIEVIYDEDGTIRTIDGTFTDQKVISEEDAAAVLNNASALFGDDVYFNANDIDYQFVGDEGTFEEHIFRYSPTIDNIPILGSQIIIVTDINGNVTGLFSAFDNDINAVDTYETLASDEAIEIALEATFAREDVVTFLERVQSAGVNAEDIRTSYMELFATNCTLLIYAADQNAAPTLAYAVTVTNYKYATEDSVEDSTESDYAGLVGSPIVDTTYYLYANGTESGTIFKSVENTEGWSTVYLEGTDLLGSTRSFTGEEEDGTYRLKDTTRNLITYKTATTGMLWWKEYVLPGNIATTNSFFGYDLINKAAVSAHANMTETFDFYNDILGRKSFDGNGATVKVSYNYGDNYENAYWTSSGQQFVFGSGDDYVAALDVVAHEYTHAVISYVVGNGTTTTLTYFGETGALNEAYADIMGSLVEGKTGTGLWTIGEDMGSVMRSMKNPTAYSQPDHYSALSDPQWDARLNQYQNRDNEGVHIFGGVYCHAAYKMMEDNRCNGISKETWAKVFYRSLFRLTTTASFLDGRGAVISAAKNLGFTQPQLQAIKDAFNAVGIVEPNAIRITLQWGEFPADLDSHIVGPGVVDGERFHVYYGQRNYYCDGTYYSSTEQYAVDLDYDDTTSFGPEVTTIHLLTPGVYYFYVHDFTNGGLSSSTDMANSGATVKVYSGSSSSAIAEYTIDPSSQGTYWNVFQLNIDENMTINLVPINTYGSAPSYS